MPGMGRCGLLICGLSLAAAAAGASPGDGPPVSAREVSFANGDVELAGTLLLPGGSAPFPGAVIVHGSGTSDRTNDWARSIARLLAENGIAVLFPDKRGSGASGGDWRTATFADLAADALAALERLRAAPEVAADRVGLVGLSQGGRVAPLAAAGNGAVRFAVSVSGAATPLADTVAWEVEQAWRREGVGETAVERGLELLRLSNRYARSAAGWAEYLKARTALERDYGPRAVATFPADPDDRYWAWWGALVDSDPMEHWRRVEQPALFVYGELDDNAPVAASVERIERELIAPGRDVTARVFPRAGHGLRAADGALLPELETVLTGWIHRVTADGGGTGPAAAGALAVRDL